MAAHVFDIPYSALQGRFNKGSYYLHYIYSNVFFQGNAYPPSFDKMVIHNSSN